MSAKWLSLLAAAVVTAGITSTAGVTAPAGSKSGAGVASRGSQSTAGWQLNQSFYYYGAIKTKTSPRGTFTETKDLNLYLLPDSSGFIYNRTNKKYCSLNPKVWLTKFGAQQVLGPISKVGTANYCGHPVTRYNSMAYEPPKTQPEYMLEFWTTADLHGLPTKIVNDFSTLTGVPKGYGMPMRVFRTYNYPHGKQELFLETLQVQPVKMVVSDFQPPKSGYVRVTDEMDVLLAEGDDEMSTLLGETCKPAQKLPRRPR